MWAWKRHHSKLKKLQKGRKAAIKTKEWNHLRLGELLFDAIEAEVVLSQHQNFHLKARLNKWQGKKGQQSCEKKLKKMIGTARKEFRTTRLVAVSTSRLNKIKIKNYRVLSSFWNCFRFFLLLFKVSWLLTWGEYQTPDTRRTQSQTRVHFSGWTGSQAPLGLPYKGGGYPTHTEISWNYHSRNKSLAISITWWLAFSIAEGSILLCNLPKMSH